MKAPALAKASAGDRPPAASGKSGFGIDPSLPRWVCQSCRHALFVVGVDPAEKIYGGMQASSIQDSVMGTSRMENSFVVLSKKNKSSGHGIPPRPRNTVLQPDAKADARPMDESYVVLPSSAASMYNSSSSTEGANLPLPSESPDGPMLDNNLGFHSSVAVLKRAFEIATIQTQVEQPLCLECMKVLSEKMEKEIQDVNNDIKKYEECLQNLESQTSKVLNEAEFKKEKDKIEEEERKLLSAIADAEKRYSEVNNDMRELEEQTKVFAEMEERYWHEFNHYQFELRTHQEEREAIMAKIEISQVQLELLKRTNVLNEAFYITHEGEFGTINNFRLGRLPKMMVEWDEINAAWGQACLLLHTMVQYFKQKFPCKIKIIPMGSYPRIVDSSNNTYDLFGPVNLFWSTRYDKAMSLYLMCLKEFIDFAHRVDQENGVMPPEKWFNVPFLIENEKVGGYTITQSFTKYENWTKALKNMLCDLKFVLYWFIGNTSFRPLEATQQKTSHAQVTAAASGSLF